MKTIKQYINEQEIDVTNSVRYAINKFESEPIESFIESIVWGIEDELKTFKPKKEYDYVTPEMIDEYKNQWKDFADYLKKYKK